MALQPPKPGVQSPGKYPVPVGPRYQRYGEQIGWIYNPWTDTYVADPNMQKQYAKEQGLVEDTPKPQTIQQQMYPLMAIASAPAIGEHIVAPAAQGLFGLTKDLMGYGSSTPAVATAATPSVIPSVTPAVIPSVTPAFTAGSSAVPSVATAGTSAVPVVAGGAGAGAIPAGATAIGGGQYVLDGVVYSASGQGVATAAVPVTEAATAGATEVTAGAGAAGAEAGGGLFSIGGIGSAGNAILPIAGAALAYDVARNWGNQGSLAGNAARVGEAAASGAMIGSGIGGVGAVPGAIVGGLIGLASVSEGGRTNKEHVARSDFRDVLVDTGFAARPDGKGTYVTLADGTTYDISGEDERAGSGYNVDGTRAFSSQAAAWGDALATVVSGVGGKLEGDFAGMLANASLSNAKSIQDMRNNMMAFVAKAGIDITNSSVALNQMVKDGKISAQEAAVYQNSLQTLIAGDEKAYDSRTMADAEKALDPAATATTPTIPATTEAPAATAPPAEEEEDEEGRVNTLIGLLYPKK